MLAAAGIVAERGALVRTYDGQVEPYEDCELGRIDAVLLDLPITKYYADPRQRPAWEEAAHHEPGGRVESIRSWLATQGVRNQR